MLHKKDEQKNWIVWEMVSRLYHYNRLDGRIEKNVEKLHFTVEVLCNNILDSQRGKLEMN